MSYRVSRQENGLFTIHDVSIFAQCKRGAIDYDVPWLDRAVAIAQTEERYGARPPVFVKHNSPENPASALATEDADGRLANLRRGKVNANGKLVEGIIANLADLDETVKDRVINHKLIGRSIEAIKPALRGKIDGLALLGRTAPFHTLAQGSETEEFQQFSLLDDGESQRVTFAAMDDEMPMPSAPGSASPAPAAPHPAPAPAAGGADAVLKQIFALLAPMFGGAPASPQAAPPAAPAAPGPAPAPMARMQALDGNNSEARFQALQEQAEMLKAQLEQALAGAQKVNAQNVQNTEALAAQQKETEINGLFNLLRSENKVYSEPHVRSGVERFGLQTWKEICYPLLLTAPVGSPPTAVNPTTVGSLATFEADPDLKTFGALAPTMRPIALAAAQEYDRLAAASAVFTIDNPRKDYIQGELNAYRLAGN